MEFLLSFQQILFLAFLTFSIYFFTYGRKRHNRPGKALPGPTGIPILGNLLQLDAKRAHISLTNWAKKYGSLYTVKLGSCRGVIISDPALIREAWNENIFCGRPDNKIMMLFSGGGKNGILQADGQIWYEQRRFTLRHLRNFSFGKSSMESLIMNEVMELIDGFKHTEGKPISPNRKFSLAILNGLWMIVTGKRYSHDDPTLTKILEDLFKTIDKVFSSGALMFIPALAKYFPTLSGWYKIAKEVDIVTDTFRNIVKEHEENREEGNPRDLIDAYLDEIHKTKDPNSSFHESTAYTQLLAVIFDLFAAGSETTSNILTWTVLYLSHFKHVQVKLQEEIDTIVGKNRLPSLADKPNMPYTEALINEVMRFSETVVLGLFHSATEATIFHGYYIPKDAYLISNFYWSHRDPAIWGDPQNFRPERFLTGKKMDALMAFSTGKRLCLGETLARDELFLFITNIFQRFDVELDAESKQIKELLDPTPGFMNVPKKFNVIMTDRIC